MSLVIRQMQPSDMEQVLRLLECWNIAPISPTVDIPAPERTELLVENTVVAVDDGRIVGVRSFIQHSPTLAEGASLAVAPGHHARGIGRRLMLAGYRQMIERGIRTVRAETDSPDVVKWLTRHFGHRVIGITQKRHAFGREGVDHWTVLELDLTSNLPNPLQRCDAEDARAEDGRDLG